MEKGPEIRIIGGASAEKKEEAREEIRRALFEHFETLSPQEQKDLKRLEYPKYKREAAVIRFVNEETSQLMQEAGLEPYDVPEENLHIVPPELYKKVAGTGIATAYTTKQGILFDAWHARNNLVDFGATVLHEILHLKGHLSLEVNEANEKLEKTSYRQGVTVKALQRYRNQGKHHNHFVGLHEAIVAEAEKRLLNKLLSRPELAAEKEWLMSEGAKEMKKKLVEKEGIPEDDIIWVSEKRKNDWKAVSYPRQRDVLNYVCAEIQKQFPSNSRIPTRCIKFF